MAVVSLSILILRTDAASVRKHGSRFTAHALSIGGRISEPIIERAISTRIGECPRAVTLRTRLKPKA